MKSKLLTNKGWIAVAVVLALLMAACYYANRTVIQDRIDEMNYDEEYKSKRSPDGLYYIGVAPNEKGEKTGTISYFIGKGFVLDESEPPAYYEDIKILRVEESAYSECSGLKKVTLPPTIAAIDKKAFMNCKELKEIYIPASVKEIHKDAFAGTEHFIMYVEEGSYAEKYAKEKEIPYDYYAPAPVSNERPDYSKEVYEKDYENFLYSVYYHKNKPYCAIINCNPMTKEEHVTIPAEINGVPVAAIAEQCFVHCQNIKTITLPDTVTNIGDYAFAACNELDKVIFTEKVSTIGKELFDNSNHAVINGPSGSYAHQYAKMNQIDFEPQTDT